MFAKRTSWSIEPNLLAQAIERHRHSGRALLDLTVSNPTTCGFVYPKGEILAALSDQRALTYMPESKGLPEARAAVAEYYCGNTGFDVGASGIDPERIILLSGTSEGYSHLFRLLCEPGDEILVSAPSYPLFEFLADLNDVRLVSYSLIYDHGWRLDFQSLNAAISPRSRAVVVVHPNNPTGSFVKSSEAAQLHDICAKNEMAIISDEVFLDYPAYKTQEAESFAFQSPALTFTLSGISKICALPQMKLAWIVVNGPEPLAKGALERLDVIADTYLSPSTPVQLAAPKLFALRKGIQDQLQGRIAANQDFLDAQLRDSPSPINRLERDAGWYAVLRVPSSGSDEALAVELLEQTSVLLHPGHFFNFAQDGFLVASLIAREEEFREGCRRLTRFFGSRR